MNPRLKHSLKKARSHALRGNVDRRRSASMSGRGASYGAFPRRARGRVAGGIQRAVTSCLLTTCLVLASFPAHAQLAPPSGKSLPLQQTFVPASELDVVIAGDAEGVLLHVTV